MLTAILWMFLALPALQNPPGTGSDQVDSPIAVDAALPEDADGVLIKGPDWTTITQSIPAKSKVRRGLAAAFSYGIVPASIATEFPGRHAPVQVSAQRPWICICHLDTPVAEILLVKLRVKKDSRELNGGRMPVPGAKVAEAEQNDVIPIEEFDQQEGVRLIRPRAPLPVGEYALLVGRQNVAIFAFGVSAANTTKQPAPPRK